MQVNAEEPRLCPCRVHLILLSQDPNAIRLGSCRLLTGIVCQMHMAAETRRGLTLQSNCPYMDNPETFGALGGCEKAPSLRQMTKRYVGGQQHGLTLKTSTWKRGPLDMSNLRQVLVCMAARSRRASSLPSCTSSGMSMAGLDRSWDPACPASPPSPSACAALRDSGLTDKTPFKNAAERSHIRDSFSLGKVVFN